MTYILPIDLSITQTTLEGVNRHTECFVVADLYEKTSQDILFVAHDEGAMTQLKTELSYLLPEVSILTFPAWDCLPYDRVSPRKDIIGARLKALSTLSNTPKQRHIVLTTPSAFLQRVTPRDQLSQ